MANKLVKLSTAWYRSAQAAVEGRPARVETLYQVFVRIRSPYSSSPGWWRIHTGFLWVTAEELAYLRSLVGVHLRDGSSYTSVTVIQSRTNHYPAIPSRPAVEEGSGVNLHPGWNASGDSIFQSSGDFGVEFDYAPFPVGVMVGIAASNAPAPEPGALAGGLYFHASGVSAVSHGLDVATSPYAPLHRQKAVVLRSGADVVVSLGSWSHRIEGVLTPGESAQVRALFYIAGDYIENPKLFVLTSDKARGAVGLRGRVPDFARARGSVGLRLQRQRVRGSVGLRASGTPVVDSSGGARGAVGLRTRLAAPGGASALTLPPLVVNGGNHRTGSGALALPSLRVDGGGGYVGPVFTVGALAISPPQVSGRALTGEVGAGSLALPPLVLLGASYPYGHGRVELSPLSAIGVDRMLEEGLMAVYETLTLDSDMVPVNVALLQLRSGVGLEPSLTLTWLTTLALYDALMLQDRASLASELELVLRSGVHVADRSARGNWLPHNEWYAAVQYATDVMTGAVTRLDGLNLAGFCRDGQDSYGFAPDGVYAVEPNTEPLDAFVEFATLGTDNMLRKGLTHAYVGVATDGCVYVRAEGDDGCLRVYRAIDKHGTRRATLAGGLRSTEWTVGLEIVDATDIDLHSVDWLAPVTGYRWTR